MHFKMYLLLDLKRTILSMNRGCLLVLLLGFNATDI